MTVSDQLRPAEARPEFERQAPQDLLAEASVLGSMLMSKDAIADVVEVLRPGDFYRPAHQLIYDVVLDLYGRGEPADPITVSAELTRRGEIGRMGGAPYLHTLMSGVPIAANAGYYAQIVAEQAVLRRLVEAGTRIVQLGYGSANGQGLEVDDVVDRAQQAVYDVTERRTSEDYVILEELLQGTLDEIETIGNHGGAMTGVPTGFADLDQLTNGLHPGQMIVFAGRPGMGKALALDTPLPTPTGWTTMSAVEVGDQLLDALGRPTSVVAATGVLTERPCYEVHFSDGAVVVADAQHQWLTSTRQVRRSASLGESYSRTRFLPAVVTTEELARTVRCGTADRRLQHSIALTRALDLPAADLPLSPYFLGAWAGDGDSNGARITTADPEIAMYLEAAGLRLRAEGAAMRYGVSFPCQPAIGSRLCEVCVRPYVPQTTEVRTCGRRCGGKVAHSSQGRIPRPTCRRCGAPYVGLGAGTGLCKACWDSFGSVQAVLRTLGVLGDKHLPVQYLRASEAQRRALLAGLLDTDGTVMAGGAIQFAVTSRRLAEDVRELIHGLGYRCGWGTKTVRGRSAESSTLYKVTFTTPDDVFRLERKRLAHKERLRNHSPERTRHRYVTAVRPIASVPVRCVQVDNHEHLYLAGRHMIPTHNSTLGLDVARSCSIKHGMTSAIFSLEMSRSEITMRLLAAEARVPMHHMRSGNMSDDDWARLARRMGEVAKAPLFIDDSPNMNMMEIRAKARRLKQRNDLRLVVVDYLQLMTSPKRVESRQQEVSELSRGLKLLAKELEVPVIAVSQLNRGAEQRTDKKPQLSDLRECLTGDTLITRCDTGQRVPIEDLVGLQDVPVWSLDERLRLRPAVMTQIWCTGTRRVRRLTLASGRQVTATDNHPLLTVEGWRPVVDLVIGDHVAGARGLPQPREIRAWSVDHVVLLAHLLGDGCRLPRNALQYTTTDPLNAAAVAEAAERAFGVRPRIIAERTWTQVHLSAGVRLARGRRNPVAAWLDELGLFGLRSWEKFIPADIFRQGDENVRLFLRHLFATDGSVTVSTKGRVRIYYATTSRRLADDVQALLLRLGIGGRLRCMPNTRYRVGWTVDVSGREDQLRFLSEVGVHGERATRCAAAAARLATMRTDANVDAIPSSVWDQIRKGMQAHGVTARELANRLDMSYCGSTLHLSGLSRRRMAAVAQVVPDLGLADLARSDVRWDKVVAVEELGAQDVYDASVPGTHSFLANDVVSHNSGAIEQDSDIVILMHREDAYEKESARAGEADLIVAKHRNGQTQTITVAFQGHYSRFVDMSTS